MLPITDILVRSLCGFVWMIPALVLYFFCLGKVGRRQRPLRISATFLFCFYLIGVLTVTGIGYTRPSAFMPVFAWIPFRDMIRGPVDTALNIVLFLPLGFFLPLLYKRYRKIGRVALAGFLFSLSVELVQMFGWGTTDINDLITNTLGTCMGYLLHKPLFAGMKEALKERLRACSINASAEVHLFIACAFAIMVTVQPWMFHELLHIG